ncbi:MAG TPA: hypothetical protein VLP43_01930 [Solirubrobacteraceae bacterium]|nr:hypothetical protein [Solirubrobacteraceae bacterium]
MTLRRLALSAILSLAPLGLGTANALAAHNQVAMLEDTRFIFDPNAALAAAKTLGAQQERLFLIWKHVAPNPGSPRAPRNFRASDPAAYSPAAWAPYDHAIVAASAAGVGIVLDVAGGGPLWALGPRMPKGLHPSWEPSAADYAAFVHAVGERYSGNYDPHTKRLDPGNRDDLPAVRFWSVWNEPNYGPSLAPQGVVGNTSVDAAPRRYRQLLDDGWRQLRATGHGSDRLLIGELAPHGSAAGPHTHWGAFSNISPVTFVRSLYCVDPAYRPLHGAAARIRGCPANGRGFRAAHPALFVAAGFAVHPYSRWYPPNVELQNSPEYASLADIGQFTRSLDRVQRVYGSNLRLPIWNTEYGYLTDPPKHNSRQIPYISQLTAAAYLNQAEYMSWRNPRIASFMQYLLSDGVQPTSLNHYGGFASGLIDWRGKPKPSYDAWRLPLYLPVSSARRSANLEVWGCVRPAFFALRDVPAEPQSVEIQFRPASGGSFTTLRTVTVRDPHGYFDTRQRFPGSGTVRLRWIYPPDDPALPAGTSIASRPVTLTLD